MLTTAFQDGCRLSSGHVIQPLNVNTFLCPETGNITDASEHLYAVVATANHSAKFRPHSIVTFSRDQGSGGTPSSISRHSSLSILDQVNNRPPNLLDLIPPPPMEDPPLCLVTGANQSSPLWCRRVPVCTMPDCGSDLCTNPGACCHFHHPLVSSQDAQGFDIATVMEGKNQGKPRVRKLSSPNKRSLTRQRNKAKVLTTNSNAEFAPLKSHQYLLDKEKCLSDNDGDDEGESLHLLIGSAPEGSKNLTSFSSMPRQGRRKKSSKKVEETHTASWLVQHQQQREKRESFESDGLLEASSSSTTHHQVHAPNGCHRTQRIDFAE